MPEDVIDPTALDFYALDDRLTADQRALRDRVRAWVTDRLLPQIDAHWEAATWPRELCLELAQLGVVGGMLTDHGCPGLDALSWGLARYELARGDGSIATYYGVHSGLAMGAIGAFGDADQRARWLPDMRRMARLGCFALSEPERGSDAAGLQTVARPATQGGEAGYALHGAKRWIGGATVADLIVVWARDEDGVFGGFVLEDPRAADGVVLTELRGKIAKRAIPNAHIELDGAFVPAANRLAGIRSFRQLTEVLNQTRYTIAWEGAGIAAACLDRALAHAKAREQFGKPIGSFQLVQGRLAEMAAAVTQARCLCLRLAELMDAGQATPPRVSLAKLACTRAARDVAAHARAILGADGVLIAGGVARLLTDAEATLTYEGTEEVNALIVGRELTGLSAFV